MKGFVTLLIFALATLLLSTAAQAQGPGSGNGVCQFIDENGDGFNDLAPDADGDGIPNGLDSDYVRPEDGTGLRNGAGQGEQQRQFAWQLFGWLRFMHQVGGGDAVGGAGAGNSYGPGDGTGFAGEGPGDGSGFGPGTGTGDGDGNCDDIDPNGVMSRNGRRGSK